MNTNQIINNKNLQKNRPISSDSQSTNTTDECDVQSNVLARNVTDI